MFSQFWRLDVQSHTLSADPGEPRLALPTSRGCGSPDGPWLVAASLEPRLCRHMGCSLCTPVSLSRCPSAYKDISHIALGHLLVLTWFPLRSPHFQIRSRGLGVRTSTYLLGGGGAQFTPQFHPLAKPSNSGSGDPCCPWMQPLSLSSPCPEGHLP